MSELSAALREAAGEMRSEGIESWSNLVEMAVGEIAHLEAEKELLQEILDGRPAINAGLPETYIRWSQSIYSGDFIRAALSHTSTPDMKEAGDE